MNQTRESSAFGHHVEDMQNGRSNMGPSGANAQSACVSDHSESNAYPVGGKLSSGGQNLGLLTPASLQIAQLQAQLTLQRLKLAQAAAGGNVAAAANVLNQVLANNPMSQPLLSQFSNSPAGGGQLGAPAFPPLPPSLETLVGGAGVGGLPSQSPSSTGLSPFSGNFPQTSLRLGAGTVFPSSNNRPSKYGFHSTTSKSSDGLNPPSGTLAKTGIRPEFQKDLFGTCRQDTQAGLSGEQNPEVPNAGTPKGQQWYGLAHFSNSGTRDTGSRSGGAWSGPGQPFRSGELYNPEEPTADPSHIGRADFSAGTQNIMGYQQPKPGETSLPPLLLMPYQRDDFNGIAPSHLPHTCTICDKKIYNHTDWDHHINGKLHLQNCAHYTTSPFTASAHFPPLSSGGPPASTNNSAPFSSASQDSSSGPNPVYMLAAPMKTQDLTGNGFTSPQTGLKFPPRKPHFSGRVVHICNLPEGSSENDVINLGLPFGKVTNYILMRSTHQAFLEMAFVEAAQAMVQYYQLNPATINDEKLLIRMSKRYKELQLKKPGKDVESIIQDINSQREREEVECYPPERPRSRSPMPRALSPRPHSPAYTSFDSAHNPQGAGRSGQRTNGTGVGSWERAYRGKWAEEEDRWEETGWRNGDRDGGDRSGGSRDLHPEGWPLDQRKPRPKLTDRWSSRKGEGRMEAYRGSRERYHRNSPPPRASPYRNKEEDFYNMADWSPRQRHQHGEGRAKRREGEVHHRDRQTELQEVEASTQAPDRKSGFSSSGRSRKPSPKQEVEKVEESDNQAEVSVEQPLKRKSESPHSRVEDLDGPEPKRDADSEIGEEGHSDAEEENWYPQNMEELVTVDEVGEEDDDIIEPDLPELQEKPEAQNVALGHTKAADAEGGGRDSDQNDDTLKEILSPSPQNHNEAMSEAPLKDLIATSASVLEEPCSDLSNFPSQELEALSVAPCSQTYTADIQPPQVCLPNNMDCEPVDNLIIHGAKQPAPATQSTEKNIQDQDEHFGNVPVRDSCSSAHQSPSSTDSEHLSPHDKAVSEHSIPLGVEFVVPTSGFFCKLCGLFYASEETAKIAHCRSTVHYKNLQKYLSQLATESLDGMHTSSGVREDLAS